MVFGKVNYKKEAKEGTLMKIVTEVNKIITKIEYKVDKEGDKAPIELRELRQLVDEAK